MCQCAGGIKLLEDMIGRRWPEVYQALLGAPDTVENVTGDTPEKVLVFDGIHLSSAFDPEAEARIAASRVPQDAEEAWLYGPGGGYVPRILLEQRDNLQRLVVVILNRQLFLQTLRVYDYSWLSNPKVELRLGSSELEVNLPMAVCGPELLLAEESCWKLRDELRAELNARRRDLNLQQRREEHDLPNMARNSEIVSQDSGVAELFGSCPGGEVLVVGGGPSASEAVRYLRGNRNSTVIAVSTALDMLLANDILPDVVVAIDGHPGMATHLRSVGEHAGLAGSTLVYAPAVCSKVLSLWPGKRRVCLTHDSMHDDLRDAFCESQLFCGGTVTHCAVDLAVRLGASRVALAGVDLGFPGGERHLKGHTLAQELEVDEHALSVRNGHDELIPTTDAMLTYLLDLEKYVATQPKVRFINLSREGARIEGCEYADE